MRGLCGRVAVSHRPGAHPGDTGELVLTTIAWKATPLVRLRTGDLTSLDSAPCPCGRTLARLSRIAGRADHVVVVKGITIFPQRLGQILAGLPGRSPPASWSWAKRAP